MNTQTDTAQRMANSQAFLSIGVVLMERYVIEAEVGRGGYSVVYKAKDVKLGTIVAVKMLVPPPVAIDMAKERLRREVVALQKLFHPNIIRIFDIHEDGHWSFIIMDYVEGGTLDQYVARHGPVAEDFARKIGQQIGEALALAHQSGILHRDVKPQNILLTHDNQAVLTDFGSAKIEGLSTFTATGAFVGTLEYLAPEVFNGDRPDGRSDIFGLGMSLYFALTGKLPESGAKHMPPVPQEDGFHPREAGISLSSEFDQIVARATTADPSHRFYTVAKMVKTLSGELNSENKTFSSVLKFCLRCGGPDLLGLTVCPSCRNQTDKGDTCIFIEQELDRETKRRIRPILKEITGLSSLSARLRDTINGSKTLLVVKKEVAPGIVAKLRNKQIPVYSIPYSKVLSKVPFFLRFLLLANFLVVVWGSLKFSLMYFLPYGILFLSVKKVIFTPLIWPSASSLDLPLEIESSVFQSLDSMPIGSSRNLYAEIVRAGSDVYEMAKNNEDPLLRQKLDSVMKLSSEVAVSLAQLDKTLLAISKQAQIHSSSQILYKVMGEGEAHRDKLIQKLLELLAMLATMNVYQGNNCQAALLELEEIAKELKQDHKIELEAEEEVRQFLKDKEREVVPC